MPSSLAAAAAAMVGRFFSSNPVTAAFEALLNIPALTFHALYRTLHPSLPEQPSFTQTLAAGTFTVRQPITYHQWIYGEVKVGGAVTYLEDDANDPGVLHMVVTFSGHPVEALGAVYLNDEVVPLDASGLATSGTYNKGASANHVETLTVGWTPTGAVSVAHAVASVNVVSVALENGETMLLTDVSPATPQLITEYARSGQTFSFCTSLDVAKAWLSGAQVTIDYEETVTTSWVRIQKSNGDEAAGVQPFPDLVSESNGIWLSSDTQTGRAKIYLRLEYSPEVFPTGIPNVACLVKGRKVIDYRLSPTERAYSANWALCVADYLMETSIGLGCSLDEIDLAELAAAANTCDEDVAIPGSPSATEKRYEMHGGFGADVAPREVLGRMMTAARGNLRFIGGKWLVQPGVYRAPAGDTLGQDDLRGPVKISPRLSRRELCNTVRGQYRAPENDWQPDDYPPVASAAYIAQDQGEVLPRELDQPFTKSPYQAQRVASIELEATRQQITVQWPGKLKCYQFQPGSTVLVTVSRYGWTNKVFEVVSTLLVREGAALIGCDLVLRETAAAVFDGPNLTGVDPAPDTSLPSPFDADPPTGLAFDQADWQLTGEGELSWTAPAATPYTASYEVQYKRRAAAAYTAVPLVPGGETRKRFTGLKPGPYRFRVRSINQLGKRSAWSTVLDVTLTPPAVPTINGLRLRGFGASHIFTGRDAKFEWRPVSTQSAYDIGGEPIGTQTGAGSGAAGQGDIDPFFKDYKIEVWDVDATTKAETAEQPVRTEFRRTPDYAYTWEKNTEDHSGTPLRIFKLKLYGRDRFGNLSQRASQFIARNAAPAVTESGVTLTGVPGGFKYALTLPSDPDVLGVKVYASLTSGFTPGASTLVANKRFLHNQAIADQVVGLAGGMTAYVKFVPYDVFGDGTTSSEFSVTTLVNQYSGGLGPDDRDGVVTLLDALTVTEVFGAEAPAISHPVFVPSAQHAIVCGRHPSTDDIMVAAVDARTMAVSKVNAAALAGPFGANTAFAVHSGVFAAATGKAYVMARNASVSADGHLLEIDPATLQITNDWTMTAVGDCVIGCYSPRDGKLLILPSSAGGVRTFDPSTGSLSSAYDPSGGTMTPGSACYMPSADRYVITSAFDSTVYFIDRDLTTSSTYVSGGINWNGCVYVPLGDRAWVFDGVNGFSLLKSDATLDTTVALGAALAGITKPITYSKSSGLVIGLASGSAQIKTVSPITKLLVSGGVALSGVSAINTMPVWLPSSDRLMAWFTRSSDSALCLGRFTL